MEKLILVAAGGAIGATSRYLVGSQASRLGGAWPYGTFAINIVGGMLMGLLAGWLAHRGGVDQEKIRLFLGVGVLGGFTTFSAFSLEVMLMIERRTYVSAVSYSLLSVVLSVAAVLAGLLLARRAFA